MWPTALGLRRTDFACPPSRPRGIDGSVALAQAAFLARQKLGERSHSRSGIRQQGTECSLR